MKNHLKKLGYDRWKENVDFDSVIDGLFLARVIEVNKNNYRLSDGKSEIIAEVSGRLSYDAKDKTELPTVGDWISVQVFDDDSRAIIQEVLPRKTLLKRKQSGKNIDFQLIASNIDFGLIIQPANDVSLNLVDRYFVMLNDARITPIVVFSKIDLLSADQINKLKSKLAKLTEKYVFISNLDKDGISELSKVLIAGKTYCLLGQSGVGKTSLLNKLIGSDKYKVQEIRKSDGKGRHTTVSRQLICLDNGSIFIDTPGIRELGNFDVNQGIEKTFDDLSDLASECRFSNCSHTHESGCAIIKAVEDGRIDKQRYDNFLKLKKESEFYDMSYQEKRQKDKSFGKMIKNYKKRHKKY